MWIKTIASQVIREFAEGRRRVISHLKILIVARRIAQATNAPLPDQRKAHEILAELLKRREVTSLKGVEEPFTSSIFPTRTCSKSRKSKSSRKQTRGRSSAFSRRWQHHGLTDLLPKDIYAIHFKDGEHLSRMPLGTMPEDWADDVPHPPEKHTTRVRDVKVNWTEMKGEREFGITVGYSSGLPVYVTDVEPDIRRCHPHARKVRRHCQGIARMAFCRRRGPREAR